MAKAKKKEISEELGGKSFNPEGTGYDYESANTCGLSPDSTGHWPSRCPETGQILKGKKHETWSKTVKKETEEGYTIYKGDDNKYYSRYKEGK